MFSYCCFGSVLAAGEDENNGCEDKANEWLVEPGAFYPELNTILRALFDTARNC